jgi:alpha-1,2-glucosyltransferase
VYASAILPAAEFLGIASSITDLCNPPVLRSINVALLLVCFCLFVAIVQHLEPQRSATSALLKACVLSLYPLHWFFGFLYYTGEPPSLSLYLIFYDIILIRQLIGSIGWQLVDVHTTFSMFTKFLVHAWS